MGSLLHPQITVLHNQDITIWIQHMHWPYKDRERERKKKSITVTFVLHNIAENERNVIITSQQHNYRRQCLTDSVAGMYKTQSNVQNHVSCHLPILVTSVAQLSTVSYFWLTKYTSVSTCNEPWCLTTKCSVIQTVRCTRLNASRFQKANMRK
jgi:hypothetical protein